MNPLASTIETTFAALPQQASPSRPPDRTGSTLFLQILVAQLRAQNPLEPLKGTEFVTQLAQFNVIEQLIGIRAELEAMRRTALAAAPTSESR